MLKLFFSFLFIIACLITNAQIVIKGKVMDNATNLPVASASVYLNNTSIGTSTNAQGEFILNISDTYTGELIISSIGYEPVLQKLNKGVENPFYTFKIKVKENALKDILIVSDATRLEWLKIFKENFLGVTEEGENCTIENLGAVYFSKGASRDVIYAYADTPLIVINKLLGYKITFDLVEFNFNKTQGSTYFVGYNRYEEFGNKNYIKRRRQNYYGSTMHFFRSLIGNKLKADGFIMQQMKAAPINKDFLINGNNVTTKIRQALIIPIERDSLLFQDSITSGYYLKFTSKVMVKYKARPASAKYLIRNGFFQGLDHSGGVTSYLSLLSDKVALSANGIIENPIGISFDGFWVYEKLGNQLPFDYQPDQPLAK